MQPLAGSLAVGQDLENVLNKLYAVLYGGGFTHCTFDDRRQMACDHQRLLGFINSGVLGLQVVSLLELPNKLIC